MVLQSDVKIPTDGIKLQVANTRAFIANTDYGSGVLCVAESNLVWRLENGNGLCLEYPHIALHAISTDLNAFPHECLYVMLDQNILKENGDSEMPNDEDDEDEEDNITEIRFVVPDKTMLNPLFVAMNDCQALYPDEYSSDGGEDENQEEEDEYNEDGEEEMNDGDNNEFGNEQGVHLSERGQQILNRINFNLPDNENNETKNGHHNDQFEDAD